MKLYLHIGYPRTGTTTLQTHLYCKHLQINYLGKNLSRSIYEENLNIKFKPNISEIIDLLLYLSDDEFNKKYDYLLKKIDALDLSATKTNILSDEYIILNSIHYNTATDKKLETFLSRFEKLFRQKKIDVYYLFTIRNPYDMITSLYLATTQGPGSISYTPSQLVESLIKNKFDNPRLKIFMNGFLYYKLYKHICTITEVNKIKVLLYEKLKLKPNEYIDELSDYFKIDNILSKKLLKNKKENTSHDNINEDIFTNKVFIVLYYRMMRNLKSPKNIFLMFNSKFAAFFNLLFFKIPKNLNTNINFNTNDLSKKDRKNFIISEQKKLIDNKNLIKKYYEEDLKSLQKEAKFNLAEYNYFVD